MTTRIMLFNADGDNIGSISSLAYQALVDSGLLDNERQDAQHPQITNTPCIECEHPRSIGIFCACCFARLREHEAKWAAAWYGRSWQEAMECAQDLRSELSH